jgi:transposase
LYFKTIVSSYDGERFSNYIEELIEKLKEKSKSKYTFIVDNASIHKVQRVCDVIIESGNEILFLPPYSPHLNPIEEVFSKWKTKIKTRNVCSVQELNEAILLAHNEITCNDLSGFFNHTRQYLLKGSKGEEF